MAWLSAYLIRVLGLNLHQVGSWLSITLAIGLAAGLWASGALADRFGPGNPRAYALVPAGAMAIGGVALAAAVGVGDPRIALSLFGLTLAFSVSYLSPIATVVQRLAPPGQRSTAGALLLLCLNLIGLGGGPWVIGLISDWAMPAHGTQSLRIAFYAVVPMFFVAALGCLAASRALARDAAPAISAS